MNTINTITLENNTSIIIEQFHKLSVKYNGEFTNLVSELQVLNPKLSIYLSSICSRDYKNSELYNKFIYIKIFIELIENQKNIENVITDCKFFKKIIVNISNKYEKKINVIYYKKKFSFKNINFLLFSFILIKKIFIKFLLKAKKNKILNKDDKYIIIEHPIIIKNKIINHYFLNLNKYIDGKKIIFVPNLIFLDFNSYLSINKLSDNFFYKENLISFFDILISVLRSISLNYSKIIYPKNNDFNIEYLFKSDLYNINAYEKQIDGFINYYSIKKLNTKKINLSLFICWWENQAPSKGYIYSLAKFYPDCKTKGYLGYIPRLNDSKLFPSKFESSTNLVPKIICLISDNLINDLKNIFKYSIIESSPAFRYDYINHLSFQSVKSNNILITLPIYIDQSNFIINCLLNLPNNFISNYNFNLSIHPATNQNNLLNLKQLIKKEKFKLIDDNFEKNIIKNSLLITSTSDTSFQALSLNIPVIFHTNKSQINDLSIPSHFTSDYYRYSSTKNELIDYIDFFMLKSFDNSQNLNFYKKVTIKNINQFLS